MALDNTADTDEEQAVDVAVLANDSDVDGDTLTIVAVGSPAHGVAVDLGDGTIRYTPDTDFFGDDSFTYTVDDGTGRQDTATVSIIVANVPDAPVAQDDTAATDEEVPVEVAVLDNDDDVDGDTLTVIAVETPGHGTATTDGTSITYAPELDYFGDDSFTYTVADPSGRSATATVEVTVTNVPDAPVATDDPGETDEETPVTLDVLTNDTDADGDTLSIDSVVQPANGTVVVEADGQLTYTPDTDFNGLDSFDYVARDPGGLTDTGTVEVDVLAVNDAPSVAGVSDVTTDEDFEKVVDFTLTDPDSDLDGLTITVASSDPSIVADEDLVVTGTGSDRQLTITPQPDANGGPVTITLTVSDGDLDASATFEVTVDPVNDAPTIGAIADQNLEEDATTGPLAFTVGDIDDDPLGLVVTASSSNEALVAPGGLVLGGLGINRTIDVQPLPNSSGSTTITVTVSDGELSASTTFNVVVAGENDVPTVEAIADVTTDEDVSTAAITITVGDVETPAADLVVSVVIDDESLVPAEGIALSGSGADRSLVLTPAPDANGSTTVTVTVSDGTDSASTSFTLTVTPVNDAPTIAAIADVTTDEDVATSELPVTVDDIETAAGDLVVTVASSDEGLLPPTGVTLGGEGGSRTLVLAPAPNQNGVATVTVTVSDGELTTETSFELTVTAVNDPPVISAIEDQTVDEDTPTDALAFTIGDVETAAGELVVTAESDDPDLVPKEGLELGGEGADRTLTVTPAAQLNGTATITLTVSDGELSAQTSFELTVNAVNDAPVAVDDAYDMLQTEARLEVPAPGILGNDTDVEGSTLTPVLVDDVESGALVLSTDGSFTFTPESVAFTGDVTFTYQAEDGEDVSDLATVTLTVVEVDTDSDGVDDPLDNCVSVPNSDQSDLDDDQIGDACDDDADGDGANSDSACNDADPSISTEIPYYADNDEDGLGDGDSTITLCQAAPPLGYVANAGDNCPETANPDQTDTDGDGIGDACEDDTDADGILDDGDQSGDPNDNPCLDGQTENCDDNCRITQNPDQADFNNDGVGDACADDIDGDGILNLDDECVRTPGVPENLGCPAEEPQASGCACSSAMALEPAELGGSLALFGFVAVVLFWPRRRRNGRG